MSYITLGKCRSDDFPNDLFVVSKEVATKEEAFLLLSSLSSSFYDLKVALIVDSFDNAAAVEVARQNKGIAEQQTDNSESVEITPDSPCEGCARKGKCEHTPESYFCHENFSPA